MYEKLLEYIKRRPVPYEPGEAEFWNDAHISKGMLEAHLDPSIDAATRKRDFVQRSAEWITRVACPQARPRLLDLGCGPGIYAELFYQNGFEVTGMDFSPRSIAYAREHAASERMDICYRCENYLNLDETETFDVVTLIYCDFGVLRKEDRKVLLRKIHRALKPGGMFITDVCAIKQYEGWEEKAAWSYSESGFWSAQPHACLYSFYRYDDYRTFLEQYIIIEADAMRCFNIWNHAFTEQELEADLKEADFDAIRFFGNVAGDLLTHESMAICAVAQKS